MTDPVIQFQSAGFDDEQARAAFEAAQRAFAALAEAAQAAAAAIHALVAELAKAARLVVEMIMRWAQHYWPELRALIGPRYRPETIMRKKLRQYARSIGRLHQY